MTHTIIVSDTTAALWTIAGAMTLVTTYITGYSRAYRKAMEERDNLRAIVLDYGQQIREGAALYDRSQAIADMFSKQRDQWADKYEKLQQEIECHIHETYEEAERPHVEKTWPEDKSAHTHNGWQEFVNEPEETLIEKMKENL